jgi:hypothetical protein
MWLNVVIGTIDVTFGMCENTNNNRNLKRNQYLLYRLSTFILSRHKVDEVFDFENYKEEVKINNNVVLGEDK